MGDPVFYEKPTITGPVYLQIQKALGQLESIALKERIYKLPDRAEAQRVWNYPFRALEESVVNALYHRNWEVREPVEIRILPDCIEIVNQGGPDRSVKMEELQKGIIHNRRYRNRRIGDFLKELDMTEGRGTGIPIIRREMEKNGSPEPRFETDENHSYFITTLPIHPAFLERSDALNGVIRGAGLSVQITDNKYHMLFIGGGGAINGVINGALSEAIINELVNVLRIIHNQKGINRIELIERIGKAKTTIERYLKILKENNLIEYRGAKKTGGYFLSELALDKLKN